VVIRRDVRYGMGALLRVPQVVTELGARRVFLVCGRRSFEASGAARVMPALERVAEVHRWSDFAPNTDSADLLPGLRLMEDVGPDLVLGIGGGSAMDMAKLLCAFVGTTGQDKLHELIRSGETVTSRTPGMLLAPTTSGSGSEATHFAVVYIDGDKFSVAGPGLRPDVVILDPVLSLSGSRHQRATSGIDAVAQAIESLWAVGATEESRRWARHALRLLLPAIETYVNEPTDVSARAMAIGSHLAGRAIDISKTTAPHALSYAITKRYGVSHGHAVALTLGGFIAAHGRAGSGDLRPGLSPSHHAHAMDLVYAALGAGNPHQARSHFTGLARRIGLTLRLPEVGIVTAADTEWLASTANGERLANNPVMFTTERLAGLLREPADASQGVE
jgi:alcohol dehydrogenase class IV